jgi:hypothetical protein
MSVEVYHMEKCSGSKGEHVTFFMQSVRDESYERIFEVVHAGQALKHYICVEQSYVRRP